MCVSRSRRFVAFLFMAAVCAGLSAGSLHAQGRIEGPTDIRVVHLRSKVVERPYAPGDENVLATENSIRMRGDERLRIVLADNNPFLFTYQSKTEEKETEEQKLARQFAPTLEALVNAFKRPGGAPPAGTPKRVIEGLDVDVVINALTELNLRLTQGVKSAITQSIDDDPKKAIEAKTLVNSWNIPGLTSRLNESFAGALAIIQKCVPAGLKDAVLDIGAGKKITCEETAFPGGQSILTFALSINALAADVRASLSLLGDVVDDASKLHTEVVLGDLASSPFNRLVTVTATPVAKYSRFFEAGAKEKQKNALKQFVFTVKPDRPVQISLGPAFVINFLRKPKFTAKPKDGQFVIEQTDTRDEGYNLAAMMNMVPRAWANPTFGGFFQLGINPTKDEFGFYVGGGISVERIFSIGTGFTWQQVPLLGPSLSVGQILSSPDLLKTQREFRPGGYVTISVAVVNKK